MTAVAQASQDSYTAQEFNLDDFLAGILRKIVTYNQDAHVSLQNIGEIVVLASRGEYFTEVTRMRTFCAAPVGRYEVTVLPPNEVDALRAQKGIGRNLDELLWAAAHYASRGRLSKGLKHDDVVSLLRWPNFTRLPCNGSAMVLAALLTRHPTPLSLAARKLGAPMSEACEFYSAATCAGWTEVSNRHVSVEPFETKPYKNRTMLNRLLNRIIGL